MAEPLYLIPSIPGAWCPVGEATVLHFFEDGEEHSLCGFASHLSAGEPVDPRRGDGRCFNCSNRLGAEHSRLDREAEAARAKDQDAPESTNLSRARRFVRVARHTDNRFLRTLLLAEVKADLIRFRRVGNPSSFGKVEFP